MNAPQRTINYSPPGPVAGAFLNSSAFVRGIRGPLGSGKSTACVIEILRRAAMQRPSWDGIRRTRWAIIRNTYPELKTTTLKTWNQWCPKEYGRLTMDSPICHHVKIGDLDMEVLFLALDREEDVGKLLSMELTGAWVNEAREVPKAIIDALTGRVGRYPSVIEGGCSWSGIMMDTNPPDDQSWWYKFAEEDVPHGWSFFSQPSGLSVDAENKPNLPPGYYTKIAAGKDPDWVKIYVDGLYGYVTEGKAVFPMYRDRIHCSQTRLEPVPRLPLILGADFGLTPAAVIGQKLADGRWRELNEFTTDNCGVIRFAELLAKFIPEQYPDNEVDIGFGDPAGNQRGQTDERTALEIMNEYTGWKWKAAPSNDMVMRLEVVANTLNRLVDGEPGMLISSDCKDLRKGFSGGYHYKPIKTSGSTQYHDAPSKNKYSHPHDALQYQLLGGGEHNVVMRRKRRSSVRAVEAKGAKYRIFG